MNHPPDDAEAHLLEALRAEHPGATVTPTDDGLTLVVNGPDGRPVPGLFARGADLDGARRALASVLGHPFVPAAARPALARARAAAAAARPGSRVQVDPGGGRAYLIDPAGIPVPGAVGEGADEAAALSALAGRVEGEVA